MTNNIVNSPGAKISRLLAVFVGVLFLQACTASNVGDGVRPVANIGTQNTTAQPPGQQPASQIPGQPPGQPHNQLTDTAALAPVDNSQPLNNQQAALQTAPPDTPAAAPSPGVIFLPVLGPPQSAVTKLSSAVKNSARTNAVTIIPNGQTGATYQVKGYFSALDDGSGTRFIFIWDVLDGAGKNIYRISGEERTSARGADPWSAIDAKMIDSVVERTMQNLRGWMGTRA